MQKKLNKAETRFTQGSMDKIFWKRRERKGIVEHAPVFSKDNQPKTNHEYGVNSKAFSTNSNCINLHPYNT